LKEHQAKSQAVRLLDVWVIGPVMIAAAFKLAKQDRALAVVLGAFGASTIAYNARNFARVQRIEPK